MAYNTYTHQSAAPSAVADGYVLSANMGVKTYTLGASAPPFGARHVTLVRTVVNAADTPGTVIITGKDLAGQVQTETMIPGNTGVTVTGTKFFASITSIIAPTGWVLGAAAADTIIFGWDAQCAIVAGDGVLHAVVVNTTAAGTITLTDAGGTIGVLKASIAEGFYVYDVQFHGWLRCELAAASDVTVIHTESVPI
jgi:hypothetical protein